MKGSSFTCPNEKKEKKEGLIDSRIDSVRYEWFELNHWLKLRCTVQYAFCKM